jgi:hypothetical protein
VINRRVVDRFLVGKQAQGGHMRAVDVGGALILYSHGTPIAYRLETDLPIYVDDRPYSVTTGREWRHLTAAAFNVEYVPHAVFRERVKVMGIQLGRPAG